MNDHLTAVFTSVGDAIEQLGDDLDKRLTVQNARVDDHALRLEQLKKKAA